MNSDNPAARLFSILEEGKKFNPNSSCRDSWQKLLQVDSSNQSLLLSRLGKVMELPQQIVDIVESEFPEQIETCHHWSSQLDKAFMEQNLNNKWSTFFSYIDAHTLRYLNITTALLQTKSPTKPLIDDDLVNIRNSIDGLFNEIIDSNISDDIKQYVVKGLQRILLAIDEYRITGARPIMDGVEIMFGHAFSDEKYREYLSNEPIGKKMTDVLAAVASSVTIALGVPQLPEAFSNILALVRK